MLRPDTYLACQRLRSETPSEGAHVFIRTPIPNLAMANIAFYRMQPLDSADEQLRAACEGRFVLLDCPVGPETSLRKAATS